MDGGCEYERQHHRTEEPAYDDNRQRLKHLRARADRKGQRKHAGDGGQRGHGDGPQTAASGLNHGVFRGKTEIAEAMLRVEKQDAVFSDDADHHDHAHEGSDIERRPGDQQSQEATARGEQRGGENRRGRGESPEFEQQRHEQKHESEKQNHQQIAERFLLFLVHAAVFDADRGRQVKIVNGLLHGSDAGAKIHAFQARGDLNEALQILPANFRLAGIRGYGGQRAECGSVSRGASQQGIAHAIEGGTILLGEANANGVGAIVQDDGRRGRLTFQNGHCVRGYFFRGETRPCSYSGVHLKRYRWTTDGVLNAVEDVHDAVYFPNGVGDTRGGFVQELAILRKEFNHDGFGLTGQVADHVLQKLNELDFGGGPSLLFLRPGVRNDVVDGTLAITLKLHSEVAIIGFRDGDKAQLQTGTARGVFHFRDGTHDLLNVLEDTVAFGERTTRRCEVVQDEPTPTHHLDPTAA